MRDACFWRFVAASVVPMVGANPICRRGLPMTYATVLAPLDGSRLAAEAVPHAVALAERFGARLVLLRVLPPLPPGEVQPDPTRAETSIDVLMERERSVRRSLAEAYVAGLREAIARPGLELAAEVR